MSSQNGKIINFKKVNYENEFKMIKNKLVSANFNIQYRQPVQVTGKSNHGQLDQIW